MTEKIVGGTALVTICSAFPLMDSPKLTDEVS